MRCEIFKFLRLIAEQKSCFGRQSKESRGTECGSVSPPSLIKLGEKRRNLLWIALWMSGGS